jgi:2-haloacid dehalogenase
LTEVATDSLPVSPGTTRAVLCDLLMGVMNSPEIWSAAAGDRQRGLAWRDAATARMIASEAYVPYERLVADAAAASGLPSTAALELFRRWPEMSPWPDAAALSRARLPYAFVTNCSKDLAGIAAGRSGLSPAFVLSAEEAGCYKPDARIYLEACRRLGTQAHETLFVAGSPYDATGAARARLRGVLVVRRNDQLRPDPSIPVAASFEAVVRALGRQPQNALGESHPG